jgi:predicted ATPase/tRNA A-37 threonylcarbamoyl transferase component Bud32
MAEEMRVVDVQALPQGFVLGDRYRIESRIGDGAAAVVYRVTDLRSEREFAVKLLRDPRVQPLIRFQREFRVLQKLQHPNIVRVYDYAVWHGRPFFVMELIDGEPISVRFGRFRRRAHLRGEPFPARLFLDYLLQIASALEHFHAVHVVHRDIKPQNILVTAGERLVVMDFGLARQGLLDDGRGITKGIVGTLAYMSPEQVMGRPVDCRSDLFSVGTILYEMASGKPPFWSPVQVETVRSIASETPKPLRKTDPTIPEALEQLVFKLLEKDPEQRFANPTQLREAAAELRGRLGADPLHVPRVGAAPPVLHVPPMMGREKELRRFRRAMEDCVAGRPVVVVIQGPRGAGKTRLIGELAGMKTNDELAVIEGRFSDEDGPPFAALREMLPTLSFLSQDPDEWDSETSGGLNNRLRLLKRMLEEDPSGEGRLGEIPQASGHVELLTKALHALLAKLSRIQPTALIFENIHFADRDSLEVLQRLAASWLEVRRVAMERGRRGLCLGMICTLDPTGDSAGPAREWLKQLGEARGLHVITLEPLTQEECCEMVRAILGKRLRRKEQDALYRHSGGNPLLIQTTLKGWLESGALHLVGEEYILEASYDSAAPPTTLSRALGTQVSRYFAGLEPVARRALTAAAAIGPRFSLNALARLLDLPLKELVELAGRWLDRGLMTLEWDRIRGEDRYRFAHDSIQNQILEQSSREELRAFHLRFAELLESGEISDPRQRTALVARHYHLGGELERAVRAYYQAGREAMQRSRFERAERQFRAAWSIWQQLEEPRRRALLSVITPLRLDRGEALIRIGEYDEAEKILLPLLEEATVAGADEVVARTELALHEKDLHRGEIQQAVNRLLRARELYSRLGNVIKVAETHLQLGEVFFSSGDYPSATRHFEQAMALSRELQDAELTAAANSSLAQVRFISGDYAGAVYLLKAAIGQFRRLKRSDQLAHTLNSLAVIYTCSGRLPEAHAVLERLVQGLKAMGLASDYANSAGNLGLIAFLMGNRLEAERLLRASARRYAEVGDPAGIAQANNNAAYLEIQSCRWAEAARHLEEARSAYRNLGNRVELANCQLNEARLRFQLAEYVQAAVLARRSAEGQAEAGGRDRQSLAFAIRAQCLGALGRCAEGLELSRRAHARAQADPDRLTALETALLHGACLISAGLHREAIHILSDVAENAQRSGHVLAQSLSMVYLAYAWAMESDTHMAHKTCDLAANLADKGAFAIPQALVQLVRDAIDLRTTPLSELRPRIEEHRLAVERNGHDNLTWRYHLLTAQAAAREGDRQLTEEQLALARRLISRHNPAYPTRKLEAIDLRSPLL